MTWLRTISIGPALVLGAAMLSTLLGVPGAGAQEAPGGPLAVVDGVPLPAHRFEASYVDELIRTGRNDTEAARRAHLEALIDTYLLAAEARRRGLDAGAEYERARERELKKAVGARYYETALLDSLPPLTEAELRATYARSKQKVVARHLLYRTRAEAERAFRRLQDGADFIALANDCFDLPAYDSLAGYLGPIGYFRTDDAVAEAAFALNAGEVSRPVRSRYGWHVIRAEDWVREPLLAEDDYQRRREGLAGQMHLRRQRLEGDRFIRRLMEGLDVQVRAEAVRALAAVVREAGEPEQPASSLLPPAEQPALDAEALRSELAPDAVLLDYTLDGEARVFTVRDYLRWLPELPAAEARQRTAASIGRALRDEVLALKGLARGLADDAAVQREVDHRLRPILAGRLRDTLRAHSTTPPDEATLRRLAARYGAGARERLVADFWYVLFDSYDAARSARAAVAEVPEAAARYDGYHAFTGTDVRTQPGWTSHVATAPLGETVVVGRGDGSWALLHVDRRDAERLTFEAMRPDLEALLTPYTAEVELLKQLRDAVPVERDEALFRHLMALPEDGASPPAPEPVPTAPSR